MKKSMQINNLKAEVSFLNTVIDEIYLTNEHLSDELDAWKRKHATVAALLQELSRVMYCSHEEDLL